MLDLLVDKNIPVRRIACRLAQIGGLEGPLAWEEDNLSIPTLLWQAAMPATDDGTWYLGNGFQLEELGEHGTYNKYRLTHPELNQELKEMRSFIEWAIEKQNQD